MDRDAQKYTSLQDIGGRTADPVASVGQKAADAVDTPMAVSIDKSKKPVAFWEYQTHALETLLGDRGLINGAQLRRGIEQLPEEAFASKTYYEKWAASMAAISLERGVITQQQLDAALGQDVGPPEILYNEGNFVRVKAEDSGVRYRKPHLRTPGYIFGVIGQIAGPALGYIEDADSNSRPTAQAGPKEPIYRVMFHQKDLWEGYRGEGRDTLQLEVWQSWLTPATAAELQYQQTHRATLVTDHAHDHGHGDGHAHGHEHSHEHGHDHGRDHVHEERAEVEQKAVDAEGDDAERSRLTTALIMARYLTPNLVFTDNGTITAAELAARIERIETFGKAGLGPAIVARAWADPAFKARLLEEGISAAAEIAGPVDGYPPRGGAAGPASELTGTILKVLEDTDTTYHVIVCTLCSCYPVPILGLPPSWYKARSYRSRVVRDPRAVLAEFGTAIPDGVSIAVTDSNADTRFIKIPLRPAGTDAWSEAQLQELVTRDCLVGVSFPKIPQEGTGPSNRLKMQG